MKKTINGQELFFKKKTQIHFLSKSVTRVRTCVAVRRLFPSVSKTRFFSSSSSGCCDSPSLLYNSNFEKEEGKRKMSVKIVCARGHLLAVTKALGRSRLYASFVYCINGRLEEKRKEEEKGKKKLDGFLPAYHVVLCMPQGRQPKVWAGTGYQQFNSRIAVAIQSRRVVDVFFLYLFRSRNNNRDNNPKK